MSGPLLMGPVPLVVNTPQQVKMPADTQAIYVQNYSRYTVLVLFSDTQPTATDSMNNQYDGVLQAGGRDVFYVQSRGASMAERRLNAMGAFTGSVWFMPIDRTGNQASTGTVSQINDMWVSAYGPNDPPPAFPGGMPVALDLVSQPRIVTVPMALSNWLSGFWQTTDPNPVTLRTITPTAAQIAAGFAPVYLYYANICHETNPSGSMRFTIQMQWQTAGGADVGSAFVFCQGTISGNSTAFTSTPYIFAPTWPMGALGPIPATAAKALIQLRYLAGTRTNINYTVVVNNDPNNVNGPPDIGQRTFNAGSLGTY